MTKKEIREIVHFAVEEYIKLKQKEPYREMRARIKLYYEIGDDPELEEAFDKISSDEYYPILRYAYSDLYTNEQIAEIIGKDVRTVTRQKKKLCLRIYEDLNE